MSLAHTLLDLGTLSPAAQKALGPGPMRMMAARGLAPLPDPGDLLSVLYQLAVDADGAIAEAAQKTMQSLPEAVLSSGLKARIDPRVLDFMVVKIIDNNSTLVPLVVMNQATADETIATLAGRGSPELVDLIAQNEQRLLRHPEIIGAFYNNARARMSTVDRAVEFAIRNHVRVPGVAAWEELSHAVMQSGKKQAEEVDTKAVVADDEAFAKVASQVVTEDDSDDVHPTEELSFSRMTIPQKIRLATMGNKFARSQLIRDPVRLVCMAVIKAPGVKEAEALKYASNNSLHEDVIAYIANKREWTKMRAVKVALVKNAKTPLPASMRLLPHLQDREIREIARSKSVPSALSAQAKKIVMNRTGGDKKK